MKHLNSFQNFMVRLCRIKPFNVNQALWDRYHAGKQAGLEEGRQEKADCSICPWYKATTPHEMTAFEHRPPTTEGKLQTEGIRYRALKHRWLEHPGTLMKHDKQMREHSQRATDGPHTERVPIVPRFPTVKLDPMPPT